MLFVAKNEVCSAIAIPFHSSPPEMLLEEFVQKVFCKKDVLKSLKKKIRKVTAVDVYTAQKMKFSIKDFFSKCNQILRKLRIWPHLPKKSLVENFIFCALLLKTDSIADIYLYVTFAKFLEYVFCVTILGI